jgi:hypothetical protein
LNKNIQRNSSESRSRINVHYSKVATANYWRRYSIDTARILVAALGELKRAGIDEDLLIELNDSGLSFDEIADNLDRTNELTNPK